jgi:predicted nuclease of predicted toxin-antitoxin system
MKIIIDMNLSPEWALILAEAGHTAIHWSSVGLPGASDREILAWARQRGEVVFTHDLDFGAILAATDADSPSVIQVRTNAPTPQHCARLVLDAIAGYADALETGALISIDEYRARVRILPIRTR